LLVASPRFNQPQEIVIEPLRWREADRLLGVVPSRVITLQVVMQTGETKQNPVVRWPQLASDFHLRGGFRNIAGIHQRRSFLAQPQRAPLGFGVLFGFSRKLRESPKRRAALFTISQPTVGARQMI